MTNHHNMANAIRFLTIDAIEKANSGHPGMPMGMADVTTVLFSQFLKFNPDIPDWYNRDRFILSAGHGSMLIYALMYLIGCKNVSLEDLKNFRQLHSSTAGHPEYGHFPGVETTTGPLGQGIANAVGMAIAEAKSNAEFGDNIVNHFTYCIAGDGCLMEGISQEAIDLAGNLALRKLIIFWDDNSITIDGDTTLSTNTDQLKRFDAANWHIQAIDGHDDKAIANAIINAQQSDKPSLIACKTIIGYGAPNKQGTAKTHGAPLGADEIAMTRRNLQWDNAPFIIPDDIMQSWRHAMTHAKEAYNTWQENFAKQDEIIQENFFTMMHGDIANDIDGYITTIKNQWIDEKFALATRQSSQKAIDVLSQKIPNLLGGSADLTGSNLTKIDTQTPLTANDYHGNYIYYGIREHAMAAIMNGIALHGGYIPYGGTFLVFTDYARPAIRLSALMQLRVIYVMTHDSIGLGEDGPTHQPVEHLASLRAIPNLLVLRPADAIETLESWQIAIKEKNRPVILSLTRQKLPALRHEKTDENLCAKGAYIIYRSTTKQRDITLIATGSEISLAVDAAKELEKDNINACVVSLVSWELFDEQPDNYRNDILGTAPRIAIEAGLDFGWQRYLDKDDIFIGMDSFGASAPADDLYRHFGITQESVINAVKTRLSR